MWRNAWEESMSSWPCNLRRPDRLPGGWMCFGLGRSSYSPEYKKEWIRNHRERINAYQREWLRKQKKLRNRLTSP